MNDEKSSIMDMMDAGANGYVLKSEDKEEIIKAINTVMNGDDYYSKNVENSIINLITREILFSDNFNILETYLEQMNYFVESIRSNKQPMNSFSNAVNVLKLAIN